MDFVVGLITGAVVLLTMAPRRAPSGPPAITVYPVACAGSVSDGRCVGRLTARDPLVFRADFGTQRVRWINRETGVLVELTDCQVFDADTWYCEGPGALTRMHDGKYSSLASSGDPSIVYVSRWRWSVARISR
jgi:hypothetical protein